MAFDDYLPRNSESYCIAKTIRLIKKQAPQVKWVISFADGCSCGDGTIYRACNFVLTDIKRNDALCLLPNGDKIHKMTLHSNPTNPRPELGGRSFYDVTGGKYDWDAYVKAVGGTILPGYQYCRGSRVTAPICPCRLPGWRPIQPQKSDAQDSPLSATA